MAIERCSRCGDPLDLENNAYVATFMYNARSGKLDERVFLHLDCYIMMKFPEIEEVIKNRGK
jgi:hypothetical protein